MKQCCEKVVARLASTDSLVDILMITQNERDVAEHNAKQAQDAVKRVEDLHKSVYENRGVSCRACGVPAPCETAKALRGPTLPSGSGNRDSSMKRRTTSP